MFAALSPRALRRNTDPCGVPVDQLDLALMEHQLMEGGGAGMMALFARLDEADRTDLSSMTKLLELLWRCSSRKPNHFKRSLCACDGFFQLIKVFDKLNGCLAKEFWNPFSEGKSAGSIHALLSKLILVVVSASEDIHSKFLFQGLSSGLKQLGCFTRASPGSSLSLLVDLEVMGSCEAGASWPFDCNIAPNPRCSLGMTRTDLDADFVLELFKSTSLYSAGVVFTTLTSLIRGQTPTDHQSGYNGSIPYKPVPRRAVTAEKVAGAIRNPVLVMLLVDLMISLVLPQGRQFDIVKDRVSEHLDAKKDMVEDQVEAMTRLTTQWLFKEWLSNLQSYVANQVLALVVHESDRQLLSSHGFLRFVLFCCPKFLLSESHCLHDPLAEVLECMAHQSINAHDLWTYLRLGHPLNTGVDILTDLPNNLQASSLLDLNGYQLAGKAVPLDRVQSLVSMAYSCEAPAPPHIQFDMSCEGHGCLLAPPTTLPPVYASTRDPLSLAMSRGVQNSLSTLLCSPNEDYLVRTFPSPQGFAFSSWFMVNYFDAGESPEALHPVRLLTIVCVRGHTSNKVMELCVCPQRNTLTINMEDVPWAGDSPNGMGNGGPNYKTSGCRSSVTVKCDAFGQSGSWVHLTLSLEPQNTTGGSEAANFSVFVNGQSIQSGVVSYFYNPHTMASMNRSNRSSSIRDRKASTLLKSAVNSAEDLLTTLNFFVGTEPHNQQVSELRWRLASMHIFDEPLVASMPSKMFLAGPSYLGSFQSAGNGWSVSESSLVLCVHAGCSSGVDCNDIQMISSELVGHTVLMETLASAYGKVPDKKITLFSNTALHLLGQQRSIGAFVMANSTSLTFFRPQPLSASISSLGGVTVFLSLIAMSDSVEMLYASLKALVNCTLNQPHMIKQMEEQRQFDLLGVLLQRHMELVTTRVFQLILTLVGSHTCSGDIEDQFCLPHPQAFGDLLCNVEVWSGSPEVFLHWLYRHLVDVVMSSSEANLESLEGMHLLDGLLVGLVNESTSEAVAFGMCKVVLAILRKSPTVYNIRKVALVLMQTLPTDFKDESDGQSNSLLLGSNLGDACKADQDSELSFSLDMMFSKPTIYDSRAPLIVTKRNFLLDIFETLLTVNCRGCSRSAEVLHVFGSDSLLLFIHSFVHPSTVTRAVRFLLSLLEDASIAADFKEGSMCKLADMKMTCIKRDSNPLYLPHASAAGRSEGPCINGLTALSIAAVECVRIYPIHIFFLAHFLRRPVAPLSCTRPEVTMERLSEIFNITVHDPFVKYRERYGPNAANQVNGKKTESNRASADEPAAFGGIMPRRDLVRLNYDTLLVILHLWREMLNATSAADMSFIDPANLSAMIRFVTSIYMQSPEFVETIMTKEYWSQLLLCLIPCPVKSSTPNSNASGQAAAKYSRHCHSHPTVSSNPASDDLLNLLSVIVLDSFLVNHNVSLLMTMMEFLSQACWTEEQMLEAQTTLLRAIMSSLQRLSPVTPLSPFLRHKQRSIFHDKTELAIVQFCDVLGGYLSKGLFEGNPTACYRFYVGIVYDCNPNTPHCKSILLMLSTLILTELLKAQAGRQEDSHVATLLYSVRQDQVMVMLSSVLDVGHLLSYLYILPRLASPSHVEPPVVKANSKEAPMNYLRMQSGNHPDDLGCLPVSNAKGVCGEVAAAACEVWINFATWMYEDLSSQFSFTFPHPSQFRGDESDIGTEFQDVIDKTSDRSRKAWLNFCRTVGMEKNATTQKRGILSARNLKMVHSYQQCKSMAPDLGTCDHYVNVKSFEIAVEIKEAVDAVCRQNALSSARRQITAQANWQALESELYRDGGLWGPAGESKMKKWQLNTLCEGPCRMRKKFCENINFYINYPSQDGTEDEGVVSKKQAALSYDSVALHKSIMSPIGTATNLKGLMLNQSSNRVPSVRDELGDTSSISDDVSSVQSLDSSLKEELPPLPCPRSSQSGVLKMLNSEILGSYPCVLVEGLDVVEGHFAFCESSFYILRGVRLEHAGHLPGDLKELAKRQQAARREPTTASTMHYHYTEVRELYKRRFLLQNCAMEVFLTNGRNHLLAFGKVVRDVVYQRLLGVSHAILSNPDESVSGMSRQRSTGLLSGFRMKYVTERWLRDEISNFQYLMHLNTLAGRTYNDLMQYPIFPWILRDYTSETLDLSNVNTYRDLSQPMGAQSPARLDQFKKRYVELNDLNHKPYLYGTHYSSAMIVSSYLIRMEPFTQHFLNLQGGQFDLPDRMFHSIEEQWHSASTVNMADIKELIPEFFYLPDFLRNSNNFRLGVKQNGSMLDDVILPPWAKGDPHEFIRLHREALESPYVTAHLNEWIDLVFGYKQTGAAAQEANNIFHHLFYEGAVNIEDIDDRVERQATVSFINNFGQMPQQLFKKPHPLKRSRESLSTGSDTTTPPAAPSSASITAESSSHRDASSRAALRGHHSNDCDPAKEPDTSQAARPTTLMRQTSFSSGRHPLFCYLDRLGSPEEPFLQLSGPVGQICVTDKSLRAVEHSRALVPPACSSYVAWWLPDNSLRFSSNSGSTVIETLQNYQFSACEVPSAELLITGGSNGLICIWDMNNATKAKGTTLKMRKTLHGHLSMITCLASCLTYSVLVSAAKDGSCILWDLNQYRFVRRLPVHDSPISSIHINSSTGDIVTCADCTLSLWTINGDLLASATIPSPGGTILCCCMSEQMTWNSKSVIITGSADGIVRFWRLQWVETITADDYDDETCSGSNPTGDSVFSDPLMGLNRSVVGSARNSLTGVEYCSDSRSCDFLDCITIHHSGLEVLARQKFDGSPVIPKSDTRKEKERSRSSRSPSQLSRHTSVDSSKSASSKSSDSMIWKRRLRLVHRLMKHTAFDYPGNLQPASVTAIRLSKNNRQIFIGDLRGRVFNWKGVIDKAGTGVRSQLSPNHPPACGACGITLMELAVAKCASCESAFCFSCCNLSTELGDLCESCCILQAEDFLMD